MRNLIRRPRSLAVVLLSLSMLAGTAQAATIVANTGANNSAGGQSSVTTVLGASFLSPTVATTLTSVVIPMESASGSPNVALSLFTDSVGLPGTQISALGVQNVLAPPPGGSNNYTFTPGAGVSLAASTNYWLVLSCSNCSPSGLVPGVLNNWGGTSAVIASGLPGAAVGDGKGVSSNSGATWGVFQSGTSFLFQVNGDVQTSVPEPGTLSLLGFGLVALVVARRR